MMQLSGDNNASGTRLRSAAMGRPSQIPLAVFGQRLKSALEKARMTQTELLRRLGGDVPQNTLYRYAIGKTPPPSDLVGRIADILGVTTDDLLGRQQTSSEPIRDEPGDPVDLAIAFYLRGRAASPALRPRILAKLAVLAASTGPTDELLLAVVKGEIAAERSESTGLPSKTAEAPDHVPAVRPGGTPLED